MKKLIYSLAVFSALMFTNSTKANSPIAIQEAIMLLKQTDNFQNLSNSIFFMKIDVRIKSREGCVFHIVGNYSVWDGSFTGTVEGLGGNSGCPEGTWHFGLITHDDGTTEVKGRNPFTVILSNEPDTLLSLIKLIKEASE